MFFNTETGVELKNEKQKIIRKIYQLSREKRSWDLDNDITDKDLVEELLTENNRLAMVKAMREHKGVLVMCSLYYDFLTDDEKTIRSVEILSKGNNINIIG